MKNIYYIHYIHKNYDKIKKYYLMAINKCLLCMNDIILENLQLNYL